MERFLTHNPNTSQEIVHQEPQEHANHIDLQSISHPTQHKQTLTQLQPLPYNMENQYPRFKQKINQRGERKWGRKYLKKQGKSARVRK